MFALDLVPMAGKLVERSLGVDRVVEHDAVDDQAERADLFFLAALVGLRELAFVAVEDTPCELWRPSPRLICPRIGRR